MNYPVRRASRAARVLVTDVRDGGDRVEAAIAAGGARYRIAFTAPGRKPGGAGDALVPLALIPALTLGADVEIEAPVAAATIAAAHRAQAQFARWFRTLRPVGIQAPERAPDRAAPGTLAPMSGGVDSLYTVLKRRSEITALFFVHGFDVELGMEALRRTVSARLRDVASGAGLPLIEMEANVRDMTEDFWRWHYAHGAALVAAATLLRGVAGRVVIPSTYTRGASFPWGSHADLDPLWSNAEQTFEHDAAEVTRVDKIRALAASDSAIRTLRVCWKNPEGAYNCGRCEKCLRTMAALRAVGVDGRDTAFPPLDLALLRMAPLTPNNLPHWHEVRDAASAAGDDELAGAVDAAVARHFRVERRARVRRALAGIPGARLAWAWMRR